MAEAEKPGAQSIARSKAAIIKNKLENRRARSPDGTPVSYSISKGDVSDTTDIGKHQLEKTCSDPEIAGNLVIFNADGLFSHNKSNSSFQNISTGPGKKVYTSTSPAANERPAFLPSENDPKPKADIKLLSQFVDDSHNKQHMAEFPNPLHKINQPRFHKGGGVFKPIKPAIGSKPVVPPKPPGFGNKTKDEPQLPSTKTALHSPVAAGSDDDMDGLYAEVVKPVKPSPLYPPPRQLPDHTNRNITSQHFLLTNNQTNENPVKNETEKKSAIIPEFPIYATVDKSKKCPKLLNKKVSLTTESRSESDPTPMDISAVSGAQSTAIQGQLEGEKSPESIDVNKEDSEFDDDEPPWDPDDFDDDDSDFSEISDHSSRSGSQDGKETMVFPCERSKKLYNIAHEILTTERAYVRRLHLLDQVFYFRLKNECLSHGHIPPEVIQDVFSNISAIYKLHNDFLLPKLEERMKEWNTNNIIGDILKTLAPFLKLYTAYIANFDKANDTLSVWTKKSPKFAAIIEDIQKSKECENLTLSNHMLEPIQRVPRYKLLLRDYLGKLPEDSPDYKNTQDAFEIISEAATHANDSMKKMERFKKLLEIQERLFEGFNVVTAGRQFLKEGELTKVAARSKAGHQERTLLLFNNVLLCCAKIPGTNKLKVKVQMDLDGMQIGEADEDVELSHTFRITSKQKVIDFSSISADDRAHWVTVINETVQEFLQKRQSYKRGIQSEVISECDLGKKAPAWVRDEAVTMCMLCDVLFTITRRRHHCRACGAIFCNNCCHFKTELEYTGGKQNRVCKNCYKILVRGANESSVREKTEEQQMLDVRKISYDTKVLLSGFLNYRAGSEKNWVKRWCVLSDTFVFYCYKAKKDTKAAFSIPLPGYVVDKPNLADELDKKNAFKLHHKNVVVHFFAPDSNELLERWMHNLHYAVKAERIPEKQPEQPTSTLE